MAGIAPGIAGRSQTILLANSSTASQSPSATTRTYITGSAISLVAGSLKVGNVLRWRFNVTKTAAGTAASTYDVAFGTTGTTSDTARISFTKPAGTAAADEAWIEIEVVIRAVGSSATASGEFVLTHNLSSTGHATTSAVVLNTISGTFDLSTVTQIGVCVTSGASDALTIQQITAEVLA